MDVSGWSVQYASANGTSWQVTALPAVTLQPGQYLLVQEAAGTTLPNAPLLPTPDATGTIPMAAGSGKVALVTNTTALTCGAAIPCLPNPAIRDLVGYGADATSFEGAGPTSPTLTNSTAALRAADGCTDSDSNAADFVRLAPAPRNSAVTTSPCPPPGNQPVVASCPASLSVDSGAAGQAALSAADADGVVAAGIISSAPVSGISLAFTAATATGGTASGSLQVGPGTALGSYSVQVQFSNNDAEPQSASCTVQVSVVPPPILARIREIQGAAHLSPLDGAAACSRCRASLPRCARTGSTCRTRSPTRTRRPRKASSCSRARRPR